MAWAGGQVTVSATPQLLTTALGLTVSGPVNSHFKQLDVRAATANGAAVYLGPSTVTNVPANARAQIGPGQSFTLGSYTGPFQALTEIFIVGTASDVVFISVVF